MDISVFNKHFNTEAKCLEAFTRWRWRDGFVCTRCGDTRYHALSYRNLRQCGNAGCRRQVSVTAGTPFDGTKLSMRTILLALRRIEVREPHPVTAMTLSIEFHISYSAARRLKAKLLKVMNSEENPLRLSLLLPKE